MSTARAIISTKITALEAELATLKADWEKHAAAFGAFLDVPEADALAAWRWLGTHLLSKAPAPAPAA